MPEHNSAEYRRGVPAVTDYACACTMEPITPDHILIVAGKFAGKFAGNSRVRLVFVAIRTVFQMMELQPSVLRQALEQPFSTDRAYDIQRYPSGK
jgi:hypothetical protein